MSRRLVTGIDAEGRSGVLFDGPARGPLIWRSAVPVDNRGREDAGAVPMDEAFLNDPSATNFLLVELLPSAEPVPPGMHATDTIDYIVVLRGELVLVLEAGEEILHAGDLVVDRGVPHGWRVNGSEPALFAVVMIPAKPSRGDR